MAPTELRRLIAQQDARGKTISAVLTRMKARKPEQLSKKLLAGWIKEIKRHWRECQHSHIEISSREDAVDDPYLVDDRYSTIAAIYDSCHQQLLEVLTPLQQADSRVINAPSTEGIYPHNATRLPQLELSKFSGSYGDWPSFRASFVSAIHSKPFLTNTEKFAYLRNCLTGEAANFIKDIKLSDEEYESTWSALEERYANQRAIINQHLSTLHMLPKLKQGSAAGIRNLVTETQRCVRALKNIGREPLWEDELVWRTVHRLDPETQQRWEQHLTLQDSILKATSSPSVSGGPRQLHLPTFADLCDFLEGQARAHYHSGTSESARHNVRRERAQQWPAVPTRVFNARKRPGASSAPVKFERRCPVCSADHRIYTCPRFREQLPAGRRQEARRLELCYNCLGEGHVGAVCRSSRGCAECGQNHHTLLHVVRGPRADADAEAESNEREASTS